MKPDDMYAGWHRVRAMTGFPRDLLDAARRTQVRVNRDQDKAKLRLQILQQMAKK
jgi:hypothetical protein